MLLNCGDRTRTGAFSMVWPLTEVECQLGFATFFLTHLPQKPLWNRASIPSNSPIIHLESPRSPTPYLKKKKKSPQVLATFFLPTYELLQLAIYILGSAFQFVWKCSKKPVSCRHLWWKAGTLKRTDGEIPPLKGSDFPSKTRL